MNALHMARSAYAPATSLRTPRATEYQAFAKITQRLSSLSQRPDDFTGLVAALTENRALWTILASDVAENDNGLPNALRAQIFYLAEFTALHTRKILKGEAEINALIDINTAIMRGLRASADPA